MLGNRLGYSDDAIGHTSYLSRFLSVGTYTVAVGRYSFRGSEAREGFMKSMETSGTLSVRSAVGVAVAAADIATVPEPGTWALLGTGLLGVSSMARRRGAATAA
jgi:hypothetical protein